MDEGRSLDDVPSKKSRRALIVFLAVVITSVVVIAILLSGMINTAGSKDNDKMITKTNSELIMTVNDLPSGWEVANAYSLDPYSGQNNITESGVVRYNLTTASWPDRVEVITLNIARMSSIEYAIALFNHTFGDEGADHWQGIDLQTVGNVSVGDQAILCSGNWTSSHAAIKTLVFRENNVIVQIIYEATENVDLSNETIIKLAEKQEERLLG